MKPKLTRRSAPATGPLACALVLLAGVLLAGCGQTGPLYLPDEAAGTAAPPEQPAAESGTEIEQEDDGSGATRNGY